MIMSFNKIEDIKHFCLHCSSLLGYLIPKIVTQTKGKKILAEFKFGGGASQHITSS